MTIPHSRGTPDAPNLARAKPASCRAPHAPLCSVAVELPAPDAGVEAGARALLREHRRGEAGRADAPHRAPSGRPDPRGKTSVPRKENRMRPLSRPHSREPPAPPAHPHHRMVSPESPDGAAPPARAPLTAAWDGGGIRMSRFTPCLRMDTRRPSPRSP